MIWSKKKSVGSVTTSTKPPITEIAVPEITLDRYPRDLTEAEKKAMDKLTESVREAALAMGRSAASAVSAGSALSALGKFVAKPYTSWREQSIALAYEEFPQFLGVRLERQRNGMAREDSTDGTRMGGRSKWESYFGATAENLNEILHLSEFRKRPGSWHSAYAQDVDDWVRGWGEGEHRELAAHMARVTGKANVAAEKMAELAARKEEAAKAAEQAEKTHLKMKLDENRMKAERDAFIAAERERETVERELQEAAEFELRVSAGAGGW